MKRPGLVIGGVLFIGLLVVGIFAAAKIAFPLYIAMHRDEMELKFAQADRKQQEQLDALNEAQAKAEPAPVVPAAAEAPDPKDHATEDDWLAAIIAREIVSMSEAIRNPDQALPDLKVKTQVDPTGRSVHVEVDGTSSGDMIANLTPVFAWDADGYAPLARKSLAGLTADGAGDPADILSDLQDLTGYELAKTDVRLSADLQQHPASWQDHEAAAFALCALALRENAGYRSDPRRMLCRATAHLALAQALRGSRPPTWAGLMADAAIRTLSGRELDALAHLDALAARPDAPASAAPWLTALRTEATQDWRLARITPKSPLVLRIAWFQVLANDLDDAPAVHRLDQIVTPPGVDANGNVNMNAGGGDWQLTDWGRAVLSAPAGLTVQNGARFTEPQIILELQELNQVFNAEGAPPVDGRNLATTLAERENDSVAAGAEGKPAWHAIGLGTFKDATRRHLFMAADEAYAYYARQIGSHDMAEAFRARMEVLLRGVPGADREMTMLGDGVHDDAARATDLSTDPSEIPAALGNTVPGYVRAKAFYSRGVPFGTTFQARLRLENLGVDPTIVSAEMKTLSQVDAIKEQIKDLPIREQLIKFHELTAPINKQLAADELNRGPSPHEKELLKLNPDNYDLATDHLKGNALLAAARPFFDYNTRAFGWLELDPPAGLPEPGHEEILRRHAVFNPAMYFPLGTLLREEGKPDEAAAMDRLGVADTDDELALAVAVYYLVEYDLDHGSRKEAEQVAQRAYATGSGDGVHVEMLLLDREGHLDGAEKMGLQLLQEGYTAPILGLYTRHRDYFHTQYAAEMAAYFPYGMERTTLAAFHRPPDGGVRISGDPPPDISSGLKMGDVIVACNGYRVTSSEQYDMVRDQQIDPAMDFIVWRDGSYHEFKSSRTDHTFHSALETYTPGPE